MMRDRQKIAGAFVFTIIAFGTVLAACGYNYFKMDMGGQNQIAQPIAKYEASKVWTRTRDLTAEQNAAQHFKKHADEFGFQNQNEYVDAAVKFVIDPSPDMLITKQRDGDYAYYNPKTAEYAVKTRRGRIRTYFKLNPQIHGYATNLDYFRAQAKKPANDNIQDYERRPSLQ